jgi:hypothetical protein
MSATSNNKTPVVTPRMNYSKNAIEDSMKTMSLSANAANSNNATPVVTPRMNYSKNAIENAFKTPSPRTLGKKALNRTTQYITPDYRKHFDEELGYQVFQVKNNSGKWVLADAFGYATNSPDAASVRSKQSMVSLSNAKNVITRFQSPAKGGRRRRTTRARKTRGRKSRKTRGHKRR